MSNVVLLRPYVPSKTLRAMARERRIAAVECLHAKDYDGYSARLAQAKEFDAESARSEHWEAECELARRATAKLLERVLEVAEREGA